MPPLGLHTVIAKGVGDRLRYRTLEEERGNLYLGSTAPDIRVMTRWQRGRTHFFDLSNFDEQSGVAGLFEAYPRLRDPGELSAATGAFVAGYVTHLVMDELWINTIYRPFFGERSPLSGGVRANIMDRVMQFSLDRQKRIDRGLMAHILNEIARSDLALDVEIIDGDTLGRWKEIILEVVNHPPDWERFRYIASRHLRAAGIESPGQFQEFLQSLPELVDETLRYLGEKRLRQFMDRSLEESLRAVKEYLECA
jgi:hypothetical protein